ncbi:SDR family NAD(P)-dependent oxidoreductase [Pseudogulbenkiania sp. MAI-1]|uniref:SDR family NAD(P)-dependent oxidoreductase n=1 Tax=Pseudogulbenkiania sp. MAI-1 TaxID=990370 RepID=UPI00045EA13E|nr:SDR family NAD(P)-dependent oxidoreductase [Pseudogulbenkiania sp. MAI-1]
MDFNNHTIIITGAAGNLGQAVAKAFAERGANLVLLARRREQLEKVFGAESPQRLFATADLLDQDQVNAAVQKAIDQFGRIDVLCNAAGGFRMGPSVHETPDQDWDFLFDINTRSMLHAVRAVVPRMIEGGGGKIINVGANAAQKGVAQMGTYCAAKAAVARLTEAMAAELREHSINVNCVLPSIIDTPENRAAMPAADPSRWVAPDALADAILFLASNGARAIHGASLPVIGLS